MDAEEFLKVALGNNMNIGTLKLLAWQEIMEAYAKHAQGHSNKPSLPCQNHGNAGILLVTKVVCAECGEIVDKVFVPTNGD